jgi:DNA-binding IscR family transcriptional regulator
VVWTRNPLFYHSLKRRLLSGRPTRVGCTLREIYHVFEGAEGFVECTTSPELCERTDGCVTREVWTQMYDACMEILESTTLEDLAHRARKKD